MARPLAMNRLTSVGLLCASLWFAGMGFVQPVAAQVVQAGSAPIVKGLPDFTELVEQVGPSVVNIRTLEKRLRERCRAMSLMQRCKNSSVASLACPCLFLATPIHRVSNDVASQKRHNPRVWARASSCPRMAL